VRGRLSRPRLTTCITIHELRTCGIGLCGLEKASHPFVHGSCQRRESVGETLTCGCCRRSLGQCREFAAGGQIVFRQRSTEGAY